MEVYLIRHTTPQVAAGVIYGRADIALAATYPLEIAEVLSRLPAGIDMVISSPAKRCVILANAICNQYKTDHRLQEFNFGDWEGQTWDTVNKAELELWMADYVNTRIPGGESMLQMQQRVMQFWDHLSVLKYQKVALVTHAGVIRIIESMRCNAALTDAFDIKVSYGQIFNLSV